jgi:hypothetical protein
MALFLCKVGINSNVETAIDNPVNKNANHLKQVIL